MNDQRQEGELLAKLSRPGFGGKPPAELRLHLDSYAGKEYLSLRQWELSRDRGYVATKRGTSIRLCEAHAIKEALESIIQRLGIERVESRSRAPRSPRAPRAERARHRPDGHAPDEPEPGTLPGIEPEPFDELDQYRKHPKGRPPRG